MSWKDWIQRAISPIASPMIINGIINDTPPRPRPYSLWSERTDVVSDYTSWPSLSDRTFSSRHLKPASESYVASLPHDAPYQEGPPIQYGDVTGLFKRGDQLDARRTTVFFSAFAQWFTDSILRIHPGDRRKNTSNHQIDLCQIYGLDEETTSYLRTGELGKLKSEFIGGEEFLPKLYDNRQLKPEFSKLPYAIAPAPDRFAIAPPDDEKSFLDAKIWGGTRSFPQERKDHYYATGLERGNVTIGYTAVTTLFLREHNRLCEELDRKNPQWNSDDERLFQTARNILIVLELKLLVEEYINHITSSTLFKFKFKPKFGEGEKWYRTNWIALEFDMLYRWHSFVTDNIRVGGVEHEPPDYMVNNRLLEEVGLGAAIDALSTQPAGRLGLFNTPDFLLGSDYITLKMGRDYRLGSFKDYLKRFGVKKELRSFSQLTSDQRVVDALSDLYGNDVNKLELYVGLFAEEATGRSIFGELMTQMVAVDAFSQIFTNPLLSKYIYNEDTFTSYGLDVIEETNSIQDLVDRNLPAGTSGVASFGF